MALEGKQSGVLQQLGVSHHQILDYSSKEYTATLVQVCMLVLIVWDFITTFDGEISFFWKAERRSRWSAARILFIVNRRLPIVAFSLHVYWRVNRSLDNPVKALPPLYTAFTMIQMQHKGTHDLYNSRLQVLRVWSLYNRSRAVGCFLLAMLACGATCSILARTLPTPKGLPLARLAPESLTGCGRETPKGFFECVTALTLETILLTMVFLKIRKNWAHAGSTPLLRSLLLNGAAYYFVLGLTFALQIVGSMTDKLYYPLVDTSFAISVGVVACNHLMLSLIQDANDGPILMTSVSRPSTGALFAIQTSNATSSYDDQLQTNSLPKLTEGNHKQRNIRWKLDT